MTQKSDEAVQVFTCLCMILDTTTRLFNFWPVGFFYTFLFDRQYAVVIPNLLASLSDGQYMLVIPNELNLPSDEALCVAASG